MSRHENPKSQTFKVLSENASTEASDVLLASLHVNDPQCRELGVQAIIQSRSQQTILRLIRGINDLRDDVCQSLARRPDRFALPLKQCLQRNDTTDLHCAVKFIHRCGCIDHFSRLLKVLEHSDRHIREVAGEAVRGLAEQLALRLITGNSLFLPALETSACRALRPALLGELSSFGFEVERLKNPRPIVEAILILGRPDEETVKNVCAKHGDVCTELAADTLKTLKSVPLFNTICESLKLLAPLKIFTQTLQERDDLEFAIALLSALPRRTTDYIEANLRRAGRFPWLTPSHPTLEQIPAPLHDALVTLLNHSELDREEKNTIKKWLVEHSGASGRAAASDVLNWLPHTEVQHILYDALGDADTAVEAWATQHLRAQKVPDTFQHLLQRLDSDRPQVQEAAREELASFNIERVFELFESLPASTCRRCGELLQKINPNAMNDFREELAHPFHWRRVRAARAAGELGLVDELLPSLATLLKEEEWSI